LESTKSVWEAQGLERVKAMINKVDLLVKIEKAKGEITEILTLLKDSEYYYWYYSFRTVVRELDKRVKKFNEDLKNGKQNL